MPDVLADAEASGTKSATVYASMMGDGDAPESHKRGAWLKDFVANSRLRVAGPNCMGLVSLHHRFAATMADIPASVTAGGISLVSQSGGLLNSVAELAGNRGIGLNYLISSGNEAVLEMADYIAYLADDPATSVIACIMEGAKDGRTFRAAVEAAARKKPMVVLKLGRRA